MRVEKNVDFFCSFFTPLSDLIERKTDVLYGS